MRRFYSFVVHAREELSFPEHLLLLGEGSNTFNVSLEDLDGFLTLLVKNGVRVLQANCLDNHEPVTPDPAILEEAAGMFGVRQLGQ